MSTGLRTALPAALLLALAACGGSEKKAASGSATMNPGEDCLGCHTSFTAAGTIYASATAAAGAGVAGATVTLETDTGQVTLTTNSVGNFYTTQALAFPVRLVTVTSGGSTVTMTTDFSRAGCAHCHAGGSLLGRVHVP